MTGQKYTVEAGSTLHFQGDQPHTWRNPGEVEALRRLTGAASKQWFRSNQ